MKDLFRNHRWRLPVLIIVTLVVLGGLTLAGLAVFGAGNKPAASAPIPTTTCPVVTPTFSATDDQVAIDESYSGQTIELKSGQNLILTVKYYPSDGFGWSLKEISNPSVLTKIKSIYNPTDA
jgi:hypothetical protein